MSVEDQSTLQISDILFILRRQLRLILLCTLFAAGLAGVYLFMTTPLYTAQALVVVQPNQKNLLDPSQQRSYSGQAENAFVESEVEILKSDAVALAAIEQGNIVADTEFGPSLGLTSKIKQALGMETTEPATGEELLTGTLARFKSAMSIRRRGLTYLIGVSFTSASPEKAAQFANLVAETYVRAQVSSKVRSTLDARDVLSAQLDAAQARLTETDQLLSSYIEDNIDRFEEQSNDPAIARLRRILDENRSRSQLLETQFGSLSSIIEDQNWDGLEGLENAALKSLAAQRRALQDRLSSASANSATAIDLQAALEKLDTQLEDAAQDALSGLESQLRDSSGESDSALEELRTALLETNLPADALADLYGMQQNASIAQRQYDNLLLRLRELEAQASVQVADSRIVSPALTPRAKAFPNTKLILAMAMLLGLASGAGIALLNEFYIGGVHSASQLSNLLRLRIAGVLPRLTRSPDSLSAADAIVDQPMSIYAESMRRVRAAIDRVLPEKSERGNIIMVTSSMPAEGKSVVSLSIARTYAQSGQRVLLIDADMRKPSQYRLLGIEPKSGLLEYLTSTTATQAEDFYDIDPKTSLGVVLGRTRSEVPTDQPLQSEAFSTLLESARNSFDMVVIDTPPLLPVVDTRYVAPHADCVVMVVRADATRQSEIRAGHEQLSEALDDTMPVFGLLNFADQGSSSNRYGGAYYGDE